MKHLLVTTDLSDCSLQAIDAAKSLVKLFPPGETIVTLLTIVEDNIPTGIQFEFGLAPINSAAVLAAAERQATTKVQALRDEHFAGCPGTAVCLRDCEGVEHEIVSYAAEHKIDIVLMATHGRRGIRRLIAGSVTERVLHSAKFPILVVPQRNTLHSDRHESTHIVVATDLSAASERAMPIARELFDVYGSASATLTLLHIAENMVEATFNLPLGENIERIRFDLESQASRRIEEIRASYFANTLATTCVIRAERPAQEELLAYVNSHRTNLLVIASQGHSAIDHLMVGSVTEKVVRRSPCCTLVVPPTAL